MSASATPAVTYTKHVAFFICLLLAVGVAVYGSQQLQSNLVVVEFVDTLGYIGVFVAGLIAGLNIVFPVPAATLTPLFLEAGMTIPLIVVFLALGTLAADCIGYLIGHTSRSIIETKYPNITTLTDKVSQANSGLLVLFVALYAAFIPLPNELILIPLAFAGVSWRLLIIPLFIGATIIQTLLVTGVTSIGVLF